MVNGICEVQNIYFNMIKKPETSAIRKLGVSQLNNGSVGKKKKSLDDNNEEFAITSDDEVYEVILTKED